MAAHVYIGLPGSGKSYELVESLLLPALRDGRVVVAVDVEGLDVPAISKFLGFDVSEQVLIFDEDAPKSPEFWYHPETNPNAPTSPGRLVLMDECRDKFDATEPLLPEFGKWLQKHRHYVDSIGRTSDIALLYQSYTDVHRKIRGLIATTTAMSKMLALGLPRRYRVQIYPGFVNPARPGSVQAMTGKMGGIKRKYDPKICALYSSYNGGIAGKEVKVDKRASIFSNSLVYLWLPFVLLIAGGGYWVLDRMFFSKLRPTAAASAAAGSISKSAPSQPAGSSSGSAATDWRYVGQYTVRGLLTYLIADKDGRLRYVHAPDVSSFSSAGPSVRLQLVDGTVITEYSGPLRPVATRSVGLADSPPPANR